MAKSSNTLSQSLSLHKNIPVRVQNLTIAYQEADGYTRLTAVGYEQITKAIELKNEALALELLHPLKVKDDGREVVQQQFLVFIKLAIDNNQEKVLEKLLEFCVDINRYDYVFMLRQASSHGKIILLYAIEKGASAKMIQLLVQFGARSTQAWASNQDASPLVTAILDKKASTESVHVSAKNKTETIITQVKEKNDAMKYDVKTNLATHAATAMGSGAAAAVAKQIKKTKAIIDQRSAAIKIQTAFRKFLDDKKKAMQNANWMTGTNGNYILPSLPHTRYTLIPTGMLWCLGIAPMAGELGYGVQMNGVNQTALSGVNRDYFDIAWGYANLKQTSVVELEKHSIKCLKEALENFKTPNADISKGEILSRINHYIFLLRQINEKVYQDLFAKEVAPIHKLINDDAFWIQTNEIKKVQKAIVESPVMSLNLEDKNKKIEWKKVKEQLEKAGYTNNHCWYCESSLKSFGDQYVTQKNNQIDYICIQNELHRNFWEKTLATKIALIKIVFPKSINENHQLSIKKYLDDIMVQLNRVKQAFSLATREKPVLQYSTQELETMKKETQFPLVFASSKNLAIAPGGHSGLGEKLYEGTLKLGADLDLIITNPSHEQELRQYLRLHKLRNRIKVCTDIEFRQNIKNSSKK